jgi:hypothetical protein
MHKIMKYTAQDYGSGEQVGVVPEGVTLCGRVWACYLLLNHLLK